MFSYMKTPSMVLCTVGYDLVSKIVSMINPNAPTIAQKIAQTLRKASRLE